MTRSLPWLPLPAIVIAEGTDEVLFFTAAVYQKDEATSVMTRT